MKSVYVTAVRLRMERVASECASFLSEHLDLQSCLELRALPGVARHSDLVRIVDDFIDRNMDELLKMPNIMAMDRVCVEVLHATKEEIEMAQAKSLAQLVLDWIHGQWLEDEKLTLDALKG